MSSTQFKLTKDGGLTRRLTLPGRPNWLALATRIESLFNISVDKVAVAYVDADGDEVTLSSQEELLDFFVNVHKSGESVKFKVIDLGSLRTARGGSAAPGDQSSESSAQDGFTGGGLGNMGPTMIIDVDAWDGMPSLPNLRLFGLGDSEESTSVPHAYVEPLESEVGSKAGAGSGRLTSDAGSVKNKGKGRAVTAETLASTKPNTSEASVLNNDAPNKPNVHVYDMSEAGNMTPRSRAAITPRLYAVNLGDNNEPRFSAFGGARYPGAPDSRSEAGSISTVTTTPESPLRTEAVKPLPKTPSSVANQQSIPAQSSYSIPRANPAGMDTTAPGLQEQGAAEGKPSFVSDVAQLVEALTAAFSAHPELSDGLRNIVTNSVNGNYWASDRDAILSAADNMRKKAEEMSGNVSQISQNIAQKTENDAIRRIAESLGGVFKTLGDLTSSVEAQAALNTAPPMPANRSFSTDWGRFGDPASRYRPFSYYKDYPSHRSFSGGAYVPNKDSYPPPLNAPPMSAIDESSVPPQHRQLPMRFRDFTSNTLQRNNTWTNGRSPSAPFPYNLTEESLGYLNKVHNAHESKVQLEAAKSLYRAEKERFRKEKEERRRTRREIAERRAEEGRANPDREETIVARIPLLSPNTAVGENKKGSYAEIYSVPSPSKPAASPGYTSGKISGPMLFDKVVVRLNDMGITSDTHPNILAVINEQLYPNGHPTKLNEEQILTKCLSALRIRGTPSPRPSGSRLPPPF